MNHLELFLLIGLALAWIVFGAYIVHNARKQSSVVSRINQYVQ